MAQIVQNPADEPRTLTVTLSEEMVGDLKAAAQRDLATALKAQEWGLATRLQVAIEALERA